MNSESKPFRILSIDGGGMRGVFPARYLMELEAEMQDREDCPNHLWEYFDLICGTSTGGIIALAVSLGIPAERIHELYLKHGKEIFGKRRWIPLFKAIYSKKNLTRYLREYFGEGDSEPRMADCRTNVCIPVYDLLEGSTKVVRNEADGADGAIPAYQVAVATSSAPLFFAPTKFTYQAAQGEVGFRNKVDGGVFANNPALIGVVDAQSRFEKPLGDINLLSLGTGLNPFSDADVRTRWGIWYWMNFRQQRIVDLLMQGQAQHVEDYLQELSRIQDARGNRMNYRRVNFTMDRNSYTKLDGTEAKKLQGLSQAAVQKFAESRDWLEQYLF